MTSNPLDIFGNAASPYMIGTAGGVANTATAQALGGYLTVGSNLSGQALSALGHSYDPGPTFRIEKISNGYVIHYARYAGTAAAQYFAADLKEAGEFVTATCVKYQLEGTK